MKIKILMILFAALLIVACKPECKRNTNVDCPKVIDPVSCGDGLVYDNDCVAASFGQCVCEAVKDSTNCRPDSNMICTTEYAPVTCKDGNTYSNDCVAKSAGQCDCESVPVQ